MRINDEQNWQIENFSQRCRTCCATIIESHDALEHLEQTLRNMQTDHLDLWQVHDMRTDEDIEQVFGPGGAIEAFEQSVVIDPSYAPAWAEMADTYMWIGGSERHPRDFVTERSDEAVQAAIRNDPDYAYAYYVRGIFHCFRTLQFQACLDDFEHALELEPDNPVLVAAIGKGAYLTGDFDKAIRDFDQAVRNVCAFSGIGAPAISGEAADLLALGGIG